MFSYHIEGANGIVQLSTVMANPIQLDFEATTQSALLGGTR